MENLGMNSSLNPSAAAFIPQSGAAALQQYSPPEALQMLPAGLFNDPEASSRRLRVHGPAWDDTRVDAAKPNGPGWRFEDDQGLSEAWEEDAAVLIARCKRRNDVLRTENMRLHAALDALAQGREVRTLLNETSSHQHLLVQDQLRLQRSHSDVLQAALHHTQQQVLALQQQLAKTTHVLAVLRERATNTSPSSTEYVQKIEAALSAAQQQVASLEGQLEAQRCVHLSRENESRLCLKSAHDAAAKHNHIAQQLHQQVAGLTSQQRMLEEQQRDAAQAAAQAQEEAAALAQHQMQMQLAEANAERVQAALDREELEMRLQSEKQAARVFRDEAQVALDATKAEARMRDIQQTTTQHLMQVQLAEAKDKLNAAAVVISQLKVALEYQKRCVESLMDERSHAP